MREAIALGMVAFCHMPGEINPSNVLSKHWGYTKLWSRIKALPFWKGDTAILFDETPPKEDGESLDIESPPEAKGEQ
jgi:hypothetical protein